MALFTDGSIAKLEDLRAYESAVLDLASSEGVDVGAKLRMAQREIATELTPFLRKSERHRSARFISCRCDRPACRGTYTSNPRVGISRFVSEQAERPV
jgi:hypothetical protein